MLLQFKRKETSNCLIKGEGRTSHMLATIFEMIEKILGFAGASFDAQAIVKAIFDAILGLIK